MTEFNFRDNATNEKRREKTDLFDDRETKFGDSICIIHANTDVLTTCFSDTILELTSTNSGINPVVERI